MLGFGCQDANCGLRSVSVARITDLWQPVLSLPIIPSFQYSIVCLVTDYTSMGEPVPGPLDLHVCLHLKPTAGFRGIFRRSGKTLGNGHPQVGGFTHYIERGVSQAACLRYHLAEFNCRSFNPTIF